MTIARITLTTAGGSTTGTPEQLHRAANRARDLAAAREVLGLDVTPMLWHEYRRVPWRWVGGEIKFECRRCAHWTVDLGRGLWHEWPVCEPPVAPYSSDIAAAMVLFEAVVEMTGDGYISADMEDCRGEGFVCTVRFDIAGVSATGPLAEAITRAALSAVRGQEGGRDVPAR